MGALAATANAAYREGFDPLPGGFTFTPFNDIDALQSAIDDSVAAFIVEPVQGESGVHVADRAYLERARRLCDERGALLLFDEVQCGMGRIGPTFAFQYFGVVPDAVTIAKALANGLPIGAVLAGERAASGFAPGDHGSTFGGSPIPCAAALAHLRVRDELALENVVGERSHQLQAGLQNMDRANTWLLGEVRGIGLLLAVDVREPFLASDVATRARELGLLIGTAGGNTIRLSPPLIVSQTQIERALATLDKAIISLM
jgi:acetylornithine/N-succinyldiaminopimelate aminotransferase